LRDEIFRVVGVDDGRSPPGSCKTMLARRLPGIAPYQMEALRLVDGELDNTFSQTATPLSLTWGQPLY
jgi:hypothetical protein